MCSDLSDDCCLARRRKTQQLGIDNRKKVRPPRGLRRPSSGFTRARGGSEAASSKARRPVRDALGTEIKCMIAEMAGALIQVKVPSAHRLRPSRGAKASLDPTTGIASYPPLYYRGETDQSGAGLFATARLPVFRPTFASALTPFTWDMVRVATQNPSACSLILPIHSRISVPYSTTARIWPMLRYIALSSAA